MTLTTTAREAMQKPGEDISYKMASVKIPKGTLVVIDSTTGYVTTLTDSSGKIFAGVAYETVDNSAGDPGAKSIRVETTGTFEFVDSGAAVTDVGQVFFGSDNQTITNAATTALLAVGVCVECVSATSTRIRIDGYTAKPGWKIRHAYAMAKLDLSGAAASSVTILHTTRACTLVKAVLLYTEASSADTGVTVTIGKETDADFYYTGASEVSKAAWYEKEVTLLQTAVAAGDTVICGDAGSKVGTGEILVCLEYTVDSE